MTSLPSSTPRIAAVLLAAGEGRRFRASDQSSPALSKQFQLLNGRPVITWAAQALAPWVSCIQPVGDVALLRKTLGLQSLKTPVLQPVLQPVAGGAERQDSVLNGLKALNGLPEPPEYVLIHDGARPCVPAETIKALLARRQEFAGIIPVLRSTDTLKYVENGVIRETLDRSHIFRAQTPQLFTFPLLLKLHQENKLPLTDDAMLLEKNGYPVGIVEGSPANIKITVRDDLMALENTPSPLLPHTGLGYDVHAFAGNRPLILAGINVPHEKGLAGHSDADVVIHAICDAIYGALGEGDIGRHFPPTDDKWKNRDSAHFLKHAAERIRARGGRLVNMDATLICERPKISPHADEMRQNLAKLADVKLSQVSLKATTSERLGFTGREEGIACMASVSVLLPDMKESA